MPSNAYISMKDIIKVFPPSVVALDHVSLDIQRGEVHSIIGENGAGKSTLMKALYGLEALTGGQIEMDGEVQSFHSPQDAVKKGIGMVHQEFMLIPSYSVLENIILGYEDTQQFGLLDFHKARSKIKDLETRMGLNLNLEEKVGNLSVAIQQKIEIIKQLYRDVDTLILDEPTAVLAPQEVNELFKKVAELKASGKTILFISHKLNEILEISDRITVMRQGKLIWTKENQGLTRSDLAEAMVGRSVLFTAEKPVLQKGKPVLEIENLCYQDPLVKDKMLLNNVSLAVHEKEIVGVAGVEGNGQYELAQAIIGAIQPQSGRISIEGKHMEAGDIRDRRHQIAYISQDRKKSGSAQTESIQNNALMTHHYLNDSLVKNGEFFNGAAVQEFTDRIIDNFNVVTSSRNNNIGSLSGGNQQKVIVGREFELNNSFLLLDQPVRGLDVGSIEYIQKRIVDQRNAGAAILLISADLDELFSLSDRILVMHKGKVSADLLPHETDRTEVGEYMLGSKGSDL